MPWGSEGWFYTANCRNLEELTAMRLMLVLTLIALFGFGGGPTPAAGRPPDLIEATYAATGPVRPRTNGQPWRTASGKP